MINKAAFLIEKINNKIKEFYQDNFSKIVEINAKYAQPKIEMSPIVKNSLLLLRVYLIFLLLLLVYKFLTVI